MTGISFHLNKLLVWMGLCVAFTPLSAFSAGHPSPADWRDINIYQIFTDRFNDGDPSNNNINPQQSFNPSNSRGIHGGDFRGIEQKLDYIKALGANAIWISPIPLNVGGSSYHGYGAHDFYSLAPHWGTMADLKSMVSNAHAREIYVVLDVVAGHTGDRIRSTDSGYPTFKASGYSLSWRNTNRYPAPFNNLTNFHNYGEIQNYVDPDQVLGELSGLDDLRTETEYVRTNMVNIYKYWIEQGDFDGFRIDTVKHVDMGFWQHFNPAIRAYAASIGKTNFFQFGEVYDGSESKLGSYTGTKAGGAYANDSVLDFALYFRVNSVFANANGNTKQIEDHYSAIAANYHADAHMRLVTFLDNHDVTRFMNSANANNNTSRLHVATAFQLSSRGIPSVYYGTEQNFNGGNDPANREDMFAGQYPSSGPSFGDKFNMTERTFRHIAQLNNFRRLYPSMRRGSHVNLWSNSSGPGLLIYARRLGDEEIFVTLNTSSNPQSPGAVINTIYPIGTRLVNLLATNEIVTVAAGGIPSIVVPGTSIKMFIAESRWLPLDPVVTQQVPVHAATSVGVVSPITLMFSKPMNTASVESAFSLTPAAAGSFSWSSDLKTMSFTPNAPGLTTVQKYSLRLGTNAFDADDGNYIHGGFETFFTSSVNAFTDAVPPTVSMLLPAENVVVSNIVMISGTASDNVAVDRVEFRLDLNNWVQATGTTSWSYALDTRTTANGTRTLTVRSFDTSGNVSTQHSVLVRFFNVPSDYIQRISAGNPNTITNCAEQIWIADKAHTFGSFGYVGGTAGNIANTISGVCAQAQTLYQRERYGDNSTSFRYQFDCPPGIYETLLVQAENWVTGPNQRLFDVVIEGNMVATNVDIFAATGGMATPLYSYYTNSVEDGRLEIDFLPKTQNPRIAGIQVRKIADLDSVGDGIPDWWMLGYFDHLSGLEIDSSRPEDDFDGDGFSNGDEYISGTSPLDPQSYLHFKVLEIDPDAMLKFDTAPGRRYWLRYADHPSATDWDDLGSPLIGDGTQQSILDTNPAPRRVYRLGVDLP